MVTKHAPIMPLAPDAMPLVIGTRDATPAWNALLRPYPAAAVTLAGKAFELRTSTSPRPPRVWAVSLTLAGTTLWLDVVPEDLWHLLRHLFPRLDDDTPDPRLAEILLTVLVEPAFGALGLQVGHDVSVDVLDGPASLPVDCWDQGLVLSSDTTHLSLRARATKEPNALGFARRLMQALFQPSRTPTLPTRMLHIRVPLCFSLGFLDVTEFELAQIEKGGAVVPHGLSLGQHPGVALVGRRPLAPVALNGNRATVTEMESEMTEQMMKGVGPDGVLEDLPIKLTFEVGHQTIELGQLCETASGTVFLMEDAVRDCPVTIKANGLPYAIGHLATVGASLAVQVDRLIDGDV